MMQLGYDFFWGNAAYYMHNYENVKCPLKVNALIELDGKQRMEERWQGERHPFLSFKHYEAIVVAFIFISMRNITLKSDIFTITSMGWDGNNKVSPLFVKCVEQYITFLDKKGQFIQLTRFSSLHKFKCRMKKRIVSQGK